MRAHCYYVYFTLQKNVFADCCYMRVCYRNGYKILCSLLRIFLNKTIKYIYFFFLYNKDIFIRHIFPLFAFFFSTYLHKLKQYPNIPIHEQILNTYFLLLYPHGPVMSNHSFNIPSYSILCNNTLGTFYYICTIK